MAHLLDVSTNRLLDHRVKPREIPPYSDIDILHLPGSLCHFRGNSIRWWNIWYHMPLTSQIMKSATCSPCSKLRTSWALWRISDPSNVESPWFSGGRGYVYFLLFKGKRLCFILELCTTKPPTEMFLPGDIKKYIYSVSLQIEFSHVLRFGKSTIAMTGAHYGRLGFGVRNLKTFVSKSPKYSVRCWVVLRLISPCSNRVLHCLAISSP